MSPFGTGALGMRLFFMAVKIVRTNKAVILPEPPLPWQWLIWPGAAPREADGLHRLVRPMRTAGGASLQPSVSEWHLLSHVLVALFRPVRLNRRHGVCRTVLFPPFCRL